MMWWLAAVAVLAIVLGWYAGWTARRLDRLHRRLDAASAAFDEQLARRASAAFRCNGETLRPLARHVLDLRGRLDDEREAAESSLSGAISTHLRGRSVEAGSFDAELIDQASRSAVARRFYNDTVRDVLHARDRRVVRWGHLAGRAPRPSYVEMDDGGLPRVPASMPVGTQAGTDASTEADRPINARALPVADS